MNYLSIFCRDLQKLLKPIYELTRKGRPFVWQEEQQVAFETIKERMMNPPILYLPKPGGRFILYVVPPQSWGDRSDTKHSKCLLLGGRRLNQLTLIPKPKGSGGARAATAQVGPANKRNDTKRCLPIEASLRPGEAVPW